MLCTVCVCILASLISPPPIQTETQDSSHLSYSHVFLLTSIAQLPYHLPALKSLMICPLMESYRRSDVTQNLPQTPFPVTMLQAEYIVPLHPHCPLHFLLKLQSRFNFCIDLVQKNGKEIRSEEY